MEHGLRILQVSPSDIGGGAEKCARDLHLAFRDGGHEAWLAVGRSTESAPPGQLHIPQLEGNACTRTIDRAIHASEAKGARLRGAGRLMRAARALSQPGKLWRRERGLEDFDQPGTAHLLSLPPAQPQILHLHNLHGGYFDLREVPALSRRVPTVATLHDNWLFTGHCALPLGCERWKRGCGRCPDLSLYPAIKRDATAANWAAKQAIWSASRLHVATPSHWSMQHVQQSMLQPAVLSARVIPNGIDLRVFRPGNKREARLALDLPMDADILLSVGRNLVANPWKDFPTLLECVRQVASSRTTRAPLVLVLVGTDRAPEIAGVDVRTVPFLADEVKLATYFRAADLYVHSAKVESFGNVLLEARACGTAVAATAVGGIPEHVDGLAWPGGPPGLKQHAAHEATGILARPGDPQSLAQAVLLMLRDASMRERIAAAGARAVCERYGIERQASAYLKWYDEILNAQPAESAR
jgi:glycosyltransferase involved in cell wall biosynthesis